MRNIVLLEWAPPNIKHFTNSSNCGNDKASTIKVKSQWLEGLQLPPFLFTNFDILQDEKHDVRFRVLCTGSLKKAILLVQRAFRLPCPSYVGYYNTITDTGRTRTEHRSLLGILKEWSLKLGVDSVVWVDRCMNEKIILPSVPGKLPCSAFQLCDANGTLPTAILKALNEINSQSNIHSTQQPYKLAEQPRKHSTQKTKPGTDACVLQTTNIDNFCADSQRTPTTQPLEHECTKLDKIDKIDSSLANHTVHPIASISTTIDLPRKLRTRANTPSTCCDSRPMTAGYLLGTFDAPVSKVRAPLMADHEQCETVLEEKVKSIASHLDSRADKELLIGDRLKVFRERESVPIDKKSLPNLVSASGKPAVFARLIVSTKLQNKSNHTTVKHNSPSDGTRQAFEKKPFEELREIISDLKLPIRPNQQPLRRHRQLRLLRSCQRRIKEQKSALAFSTMAQLYSKDNEGIETSDAKVLESADNDKLKMSEANDVERAYRFAVDKEMNTRTKEHYVSEAQRIIQPEVKRPFNSYLPPSFTPGVGRYASDESFNKIAPALTRRLKFPQSRRNYQWLIAPDYSSKDVAQSPEHEVNRKSPHNTDPLCIAEAKMPLSAREHYTRSDLYNFDSSFALFNTSSRLNTTLGNGTNGEFDILRQSPSPVKFNKKPIFPTAPTSTKPKNHLTKRSIAAHSFFTAPRFKKLTKDDIRSYNIETTDCGARVTIPKADRF